MILNNNYVLLVCYCLEFIADEFKYTNFKISNLRDNEDLYYTVSQSDNIPEREMKNNSHLSKLMLDFIKDYIKNYELLYDGEKFLIQDINLLVIHRNLVSGKENNFIRNININNLNSDNINLDYFLDFNNLNKTELINSVDLPVHLKFETKKAFKFLLEDTDFKNNPQNFDINAFLI